MTDLTPLLNPESVAVVGASPRGNRGLQILNNLERFGSKARVYPVHPRETQVAGLRAYPSLETLPETCDFVAIALDADASLDVLEHAIHAGVPAGLMIASGFGEGSRTLARRERLDEILSGSSFRLCGPNCYGLLNVSAGFAAYSGELVTPFEQGNVALIMQSGALTHSITDSAVGRGLGLSHMITTGNEVSVSLGQYIDAMVHDKSVSTIGVFIEGLRDVEAFAHAAIAAANKNKPVVALTVGSSQLGQRSALAHTGAIAGHSEALSGLLRRCGVIQAADLDEFRELLILFSRGSAPTANGVAFASISGGGTGLIADQAESAGVPVAELTPETRRALREALPEFATVSNPLDLTGAAAEDHVIAHTALEALQADTNVGSVALALNVAQGADGQEELYREQARALAASAYRGGASTVAFSLTTGAVDPEVSRTLEASGIPLLTGTSASIRAIRAMMRWHGQPVPTPWDSFITQRSIEWDGRYVLTGQRGMNVLSAEGIHTPRSYTVANVGDVTSRLESLHFPVVLKVEAPELAHKTELGGVKTGIGTAAELQAEAQRMLERIETHNEAIRVDGFVVQEQVTGPATECIVGIVRDPQVGPVLTIAPGGILAELTGPALTTPIPSQARDIEHLIDASPLGKLLTGYRGEPAGDRNALVDLVTKFSDLVASMGRDIAAAELNPVMVRPSGSGAVAVDVLLVREDS